MPKLDKSEEIVPKKEVPIYPKVKVEKKEADKKNVNKIVKKQTKKKFWEILLKDGSLILILKIINFI